MPFKNEHSSRQMHPSLFRSFRRWSTPELEELGIAFILGLQGENSMVQSVRADASKMSLSEFRDWLVEHDFETDAMEEAVSKAHRKGAFRTCSAPELDSPSLAREGHQRQWLGESDSSEAFVSKSDMEKAVPEKYKHIDFNPPKRVQENARRALEVRETKPPSQRGMTPVGLARARDLMNARVLSPETVRRMLNYFTRHEVDKTGSSWGEQGKGWQAWMGWGGDEGFRWARRIVNQMNRADEAEKRED